MKKIFSYLVVGSIAFLAGVAPSWIINQVSSRTTTKSEWAESDKALNKQTSSSEDDAGLYGMYFIDKDPFPSAFSNFTCIRVEPYLYVNTRQNSQLTRRMPPVEQVTLTDQQMSFETTLQYGISYRFDGRLQNTLTNHGEPFYEGKFVKWRNGIPTIESDARLYLTGCNPQK